MRTLDTRIGADLALARYARKMVRVTRHNCRKALADRALGAGSRQQAR